MTFDLPNLTPFVIVFFAVAAVAVVLAVGALVTFFAQNRTPRVRRQRERRPATTATSCWVAEPD